MFLVTVCPASSLPTGSPFVRNAEPASQAVVGDQPVGTVVTYVCNAQFVPLSSSPMAFACRQHGVLDWDRQM
ncbi:hypothetical protein DPMN_148719 [Dreissena polymorpha]|uniref:Sushi domain-containing protein n=1 Tax=Dreissena polymorpha TaxID=45954 RepID=A0A9D4D9J7_DREPO|nr:hypothetical protein DPMN_047872 [Dreissena polymorpha]KAH3795171.1 hypothetical protein DPMN_148719 [Dreissena polymorpha]